jgi:uncharacterized protein YjbI with pentapeptide repeats
MANPAHNALLRRGVKAWNQWRKAHPKAKPDLRGIFRIDANLHGINLAGANLEGARLRRCILSAADLTRANLKKADLRGASLRRAKLDGADLSRAVLRHTSLAEADLNNAVLKGCEIYGVAAWNLKGTPKDQSNLVIRSTPDESGITVDNLEVAQFIYLLLNNQRIRDAIDTIGRKAVLILGRFTPARKAVLDALREALRKLDYLPMLFDFEKPRSRDLTETVSTLAHMSRFVIADITDAKCIPQELMRIVPTLPSVPVVPLLLAGQSVYGMFDDLARYPWVLRLVQYRTPKDLLSKLKDDVVLPADRMASYAQALSTPGAAWPRAALKKPARRPV